MWKWNYPYKDRHKILDGSRVPLAFLRYIDHSGVARVCGGKDLKASQYYPRLFGHSVAQLYTQHADEVQQAVKQHGHLDLLVPPGGSSSRLHATHLSIR